MTPGSTRRGLLLSSLAASALDGASAFPASAGVPGPEAWTPVKAAPPGLTDLGAVANSNILLSNPDDHAINDFGAAPSGTLKRIVFTGPRGVCIGIDNDRICGPNGVAYGDADKSFITGRLNSIEGLPGDCMEAASLGPIAAGGATRWQILSYTPHHLLSYGQIQASGGNSLIPPETFYAIGPRGPGKFPRFNGLGLEWQEGVTKAIVPSLIVRGGNDSGGKMFFELAASNVNGDPGLIDGELKPIPADQLVYTGTKITFWPFIDDPKNPGHPTHATNDLPQWHKSPSYLFEGNAAIMSCGLKEAPSQHGTGGTLYYEICKPSTVTAFQRAWFGANYGNWVLAGAATFEAAHAVNGPWPYDTPWRSRPQAWSAPSGDCNWMDTEGWGNLSLILTDITDAQCGHNAGIAMRKYGAHGEGLDIGYDPGGAGTINRYGVHADVRTPVETFDPASNILTYPAQPAFKAYQSGDVANATGDGTGYRPLWAAEQYDRHGDFSLGTFTAPVGGVYRVCAAVTLGNYAAARRTGARISLLAGGTTYTNSAGAPVADASGHVTLQINEDISLKTGDRAYVVVTVTGASKTVSVLAGGGSTAPASRFAISFVG